MESTSRHLGREPKSTRDCRVGWQRGREVLTPSLPIGSSCTQCHQREGPDQVPPGLQLHDGQVKTPGIFFLLSGPLLNPPSLLHRSTQKLCGRKQCSGLEPKPQLPLLAPCPCLGRRRLVWCVVTAVLADLSRSGQTSRNGVVGLGHGRLFLHLRPVPALQ